MRPPPRPRRVAPVTRPAAPVVPAPPVRPVPVPVPAASPSPGTSRLAGAVRPDRAQPGAGADPGTRDVSPAARVPSPSVIPVGRPGMPLAGGAPRPDPPSPTGLVPARTGWQPVRPAVVSSGSAARFAERAQMRRRLTIRRIALVGGAVTATALLGWLLLLSPVLALDLAEVQLTGEGTVVDAAAVVAVVAPFDGTPLPRLDTVALRRAILDVPGVRAAEVARQWPHGLVITVVSREPVAAVPGAEGGFALLDVEGIQVGRTDAAPPGLPVISVPLDDPDHRAMTAVLTVLKQLPAEVALQVTTVSAQSQDTVRFGLADGAVVEWGSADQTALKARVLITLRAAPASSGAAVFDVSAPTWPITRS